MWPLEATGRLGLQAVLRFVAARAVARVTVRNSTAVGRASRVTPMSLTLLAETIGHREPAVLRSMAARAAGPVALVMASRRILLGETIGRLEPAVQTPVVAAATASRLT
jgi:hypothetical protein